jgi:hypothetical protein
MKFFELQTLFVFTCFVKLTQGLSKNCIHNGKRKLFWSFWISWAGERHYAENFGNCPNKPSQCPGKQIWTLNAGWHKLAAKGRYGWRSDAFIHCRQATFIHCRGQPSPTVLHPLRQFYILNISSIVAILHPSYFIRCSNFTLLWQFYIHSISSIVEVLYPRYFIYCSNFTSFVAILHP